MLLSSLMSVCSQPKPRILTGGSTVRNIMRYDYGSTVPDQLLARDAAKALAAFTTSTQGIYSLNFGHGRRVAYSVATTYGVYTSIYTLTGRFRIDHMAWACYYTGAADTSARIIVDVMIDGRQLSYNYGYPANTRYGWNFAALIGGVIGNPATGELLGFSAGNVEFEGTMQVRVYQYNSDVTASLYHYLTLSAVEFI